MNSVYKVTLYDGIEDNDKKIFKKAGTILAVRTPFSIRELLTGYQLHIAFSAKPVPHQVHIKERQIQEYGHQPTIDLSEFVNKNLATIEELDAYVDNYETTEWSSIYREMKLFSHAEKRELQSKTKQYFKSKA